MRYKPTRRDFLAATGAAAAGCQATRVASAPAAPQEAKASSASVNRPNVLIIFVDQLQTQRMKLYGGHDLLTPNIDRLAEEGVLFKRAFNTCPLCTPSRESFFTGQYPHALGCVYNGLPLPENVITLPAMLKQTGYRTALIGKDHCFGKKAEGIFDVNWGAGHGGAQSHKDDPLVRQYERVAQIGFLRLAHGQILDLPGRVTTTARTTERALEFLDEDHDGPFFMWLSYPEPHSPFVTTREYADRYDPDKLTLPASWGCDISGKPAHFRELHDLMGCDDLTEDHVRKLTQIYYGMTSQIDDGIGEVMAKLEEKGIADDTLVVFLSDHGEYMGSLDMMQKSAHLYDVLTQVPLILRWPGKVPQGKVIDELVEHHDMMPTLCTLLGLPVPAGVQSVDLTGLIAGESYERPAVYCEIGFHADRDVVREKTYAPELPHAEARAFFHFVIGHYAHRAKSVRTKTHKLVVYEYGERELYDLVNDPEEIVNLYGRPEVAEIERELMEMLLQWTIEAENPLPDMNSGFTFGEKMKQGLAEAFARIPDPM